VAEEKVVVAHNGISDFELRIAELGRESLEREGARLRGKLGLPRRFVLHVGTLEPRKNLVRLIEGYGEAVRGLGAEVGLVLAGRKGWLYEPIFEAAERVMGEVRGARVIFVDYIDDAELPLLYNMAEVFAYPSLYEGFGLPVAEAMKCGTPTLVSEDGALREVAGEATVRVEARSVESIAEGLRRLLMDEELRARLSEEGPKQAAGFTWEAAARTVLGVYEGARR
jgi:glycosyltransferase involved in cell wall biosynthesis